MLQHILVPIWFLLLLAVVFWLAVAWHYWIKGKVMPPIEDYFAQRRHDRYIKSREKTVVLKAENYVLTHEVEQHNDPARHRR